MKNEFKAGDLVFELTARGGVLLSSLSLMPIADACVSTDLACYSVQGINEQLKANRLFHATPENRQALVTLYGEDAVPKLPLRGSELTKKLLEKQKYGLCYVSDINDGDCRENKRVSVIERFKDGYFYKGKVNGPFVCSWKYAVPVDNNGNEITEIE